MVTDNPNPRPATDLAWSEINASNQIGNQSDSNERKSSGKQRLNSDRGSRESGGKHEVVVNGVVRLTREDLKHLNGSNGKPGVRHQIQDRSIQQVRGESHSIEKRTLAERLLIKKPETKITVTPQTDKDFSPKDSKEDPRIYSPQRSKNTGDLNPQHIIYSRFESSKNKSASRGDDDRDVVIIENPIEKVSHFKIGDQIVGRGVPYVQRNSNGGRQSVPNSIAKDLEGQIYFNHHNQTEIYQKNDESLKEKSTKLGIRPIASLHPDSKNQTKYKSLVELSSADSKSDSNKRKQEMSSCAIGIEISIPPSLHSEESKKEKIEERVSQSKKITGELKFKSTIETSTKFHPNESKGSRVADILKVKLNPLLKKYSPHHLQSEASISKSRTLLSESTNPNQKVSKKFSTLFTAISKNVKHKLKDDLRASHETDLNGGNESNHTSKERTSIRKSEVFSTLAKSSEKRGNSNPQRLKIELEELRSKYLKPKKNGESFAHPTSEPKKYHHNFKKDSKGQEVSLYQSIENIEETGERSKPSYLTLYSGRKIEIPSKSPSSSKPDFFLPSILNKKRGIYVTRGPTNLNFLSTKPPAQLASTVLEKAKKCRCFSMLVLQITQNYTINIKNEMYDITLRIESIDESVDIYTLCIYPNTIKDKQVYHANIDELLAGLEF